MHTPSSMSKCSSDTFFDWKLHRRQVQRTRTAHGSLRINNRKTSTICLAVTAIFNSNLPHSPTDAASGRYFESPKYVTETSSNPKNSCTVAMFVNKVSIFTFHSLRSKAILCHGLPVVPSLQRSHFSCRPAPLQEFPNRGNSL